MMFLEVQATDMSFRLMDVIFICSGVLTVAGLYWKLVSGNEKGKTRMDQIEKDHEREVSSVKMIYDEKMTHLQGEIIGERNSKRNLKKELCERMDKTEEKIDSHNEKNTIEFGKINTSLGSIDGKLDIIIRDRENN